MGQLIANRWRHARWAGLLALVAASVPALAQPSQLDAEKLKADIAEQQRRQAEAAAATAKAEADLAQANATAKASLAKAEADAAKAKSDYYQSVIPEPDKYKIAEPKAPKVNASAARISFGEADELSKSVASQVVAAAVGRVAPSCTQPEAAVVVSDPKVRNLIALSVATRKSLSSALSQLQTKTRELSELVDAQPGTPVTEATIALASPVLALASSFELAASLAKITKNQLAFDSSSTTTMSDAVFRAKVVGGLAQNTCLQVIDPDAILALVDDNGLGNAPPEAELVEKLADAISDARGQIQAAQKKAATHRATAAKQKGANDKATEKLKAPYLERAGQLDAAVKGLTELVDAKDKALMTLYVVDAQGATPFDAAIRGGMLADALLKTNARVLTVKSIAADVDVVARDGLFRSLSVALSGNTVVTWQLADDKGRVLSSGSMNKSTALTDVALPK